MKERHIDTVNEPKYDTIVITTNTEQIYILIKCQKHIKGKNINNLGEYYQINHNDCLSLSKKDK